MAASNAQVAKLLVQFSDFLEGTHAHLWDYEGPYSNNGMKAVLVTDTSKRLLQCSSTIS